MSLISTRPFLLLLQVNKRNPPNFLTLFGNESYTLFTDYEGLSGPIFFSLFFVLNYFQHFKKDSFLARNAFKSYRVHSFTNSITSPQSSAATSHPRAKFMWIHVYMFYWAMLAYMKCFTKALLMFYIRFMTQRQLNYSTLKLTYFHTIIFIF